ncbi:MAG: hypothetical protein AB7F86_02180 [Bdellovibrionales bacterium]
MNQENQIDPKIPQPRQNPDELKDTVGWILNVVLKVGAGYLAKTILDALGF